jgi:hypothetical protein
MRLHRSGRPSPDRPDDRIAPAGQAGPVADRIVAFWDEIAVIDGSTGD